MGFQKWIECKGVGVYMGCFSVFDFHARMIWEQPADFVESSDAARAIQKRNGKGHNKHDVCPWRQGSYNSYGQV